MDSITFEWDEETLESLGLTREELLYIANNADNLYTASEITNKGKKRKIYIPHITLKTLQYLVLRTYLREELVHPKVFSYISGVSLLNHIECHKNYRFTLKIDIYNFFESINDAAVFDYFSKKHRADLAKFLTKVTCREGKLCIGAPTSPMLSNLILRKLDEHWNLVSATNNAEYTRYSDDIYISANSLDLLAQFLKKFDEYLESFFPFLKINKEKTKFLSSNNRKITGLIITQDKSITIGRIKKRELRALLDKYQKNQLNDEQTGSLKGKLLFTQGHDPEYFSKLEAKYFDEIQQMYWGTDSSHLESFTEEKTDISNKALKSIVSYATINLSQSTNSAAMIRKYLALGWKLLPCFQTNDSVCACEKIECKSPGKHPMVKHGVYDATSNYEELSPWIDRGCNIAVATGYASNIVVLDIDYKKYGNTSFQKLLTFIDKKYFDTLQCNTGGGGKHFYFSYPSVSLKNKNGILPGIDFRTDGGYVIAPPSNHISRNSYQWLDETKLEVDFIKPLPESLLEVLKN